MKFCLPLLATGVLVVGGFRPDDKPVEPLKVAPRAYYRDHCQRCHGVDGSNFIPGYAERETVEKLRADIKRMAEGAGEAPLADSDLDVQTAYLRLSCAGKPFLAWTKQDGLTLTGEASDGAEVKATIGDKPLEVKVDEDYQWTLTLPKESDLAELRITAELDKKTSELRPAKSAYNDIPKPEK